MRPHRIILAALMAAVVVLTAAVVVGRAATILTPAMSVQDRILVRGGVIRLGTKVYLHDNASHASSGIKRVALDHCNLVIYTDWAPGEQIMAAIAEEDETLARLSVQAGISGGNDRANVRLFRNGKPVCANWSGFGSTANLWVQLTYITKEAQ